MRRRGALACVLASLTAGCIGESAPSGPRNPPAASDARSDDPTGADDAAGLHVVDWDVAEGPDGDLVVDAVIGNDATNERSGTVIAVVTTSDETTEETADVSVVPGEERDVSLSFDVTYEAFLADGSLSIDLST